VPLEIDREPKDLSILKENSFQNAASKQSLAFINAPENTNKLVVLRRLTPSPISEKGVISGE